MGFLRGSKDDPNRPGEGTPTQAPRPKDDLVGVRPDEVADASGTIEPMPAHGDQGAPPPPVETRPERQSRPVLVSGGNSEPQADPAWEAPTTRATTDATPTSVDETAIAPDTLGPVPARAWRRRPVRRPPTMDRNPLPAAWMMDRVDVAPGGRDPEVQIWAASSRGLAHEHEGAPRQDSYAIRIGESEEWIVVAVGDGVGSSPHSEFGSEAAVNGVTSAIAQGLADAGPNAIERIERVQVEKFLNDCFKSAADAVADRRRALSIDDPRSLLTTLSVALVPARSPRAGEPIARAWIAWIGDSPIAKIQGGRAHAVTPWDDVSDSDGPIESSPTETLTTHTANVQHRQIDLAPGEALVLTTDGFGTPLLNDHNGHLAEQMTSLFSGRTPDHVLAFLRAIDFRDANFSDDRTAVAIWRPGAAS